MNMDDDYSVGEAPTNRVGGWTNPGFLWDFCGGKSSTQKTGVN